MALAKLELFNALRPDMPPVHANALADTGAMMPCIPSSIASRLQLETADHRPVTLADGRRVSVRYVGPVQVRFAKRACFVGALVMGDEVVLGAVPMEDMDLVVSPLTRTVTVNPASPDAPLHRA